MFTTMCQLPGWDLERKKHMVTITVLMANREKILEFTEGFCELVAPRLCLDVTPGHPITQLL